MDVVDQPNVATLPPAIIELTPELARKRRSQLRIIFDRFMRNRTAVLGMAVLGVIILLAVLAPILTGTTATHNPAIDPTTNQFAGISLSHPLGTDELGRDVFARLLFGAQVSLTVGATSMLVALLIGVSIGAVAGFYGGWIDNILMRLVDTMLAIPYLLLLFVLSLTFSNGTVPAIVLLIAVLAWPSTARLVRGEFLAMKNHEFLLASRTLGASDLRLMLRHILPNAAGPIIVNATILVGVNIITESVLSFFSFGLNPPQSSWGTMLDQSRDFFFSDPKMLYIPGLAILVTVLCFNLMGDGLRDALDPHMTQR
ncbi:MAG TPA: ABC transporter permease [Ktedonobacterales bacterium]|jgi:peptide/nickel transport system permease protein|nr:ABC transporter permease [Ktedonobacterales bacterium]